MPLENRKYTSIMYTARQLFWKHGFKRVSIEELCAVANVSKMTFYKFFPNKVELAKKVFLNESEAGLAKFKAILLEEEDPTETIKKIVQLKLDGSAEISNEFIRDFYNDNNEGLKDFVIQTSHNIWLRIVEEIREAQIRNRFTKAIKPELLMYVSEAMGGLIANTELLRAYTDASELIRELTHLMAYGLVAQIPNSSSAFKSNNSTKV